jgi:hypothetical protein
VRTYVRSHAPHVRAKARELRARRLTIDEIADRLSLPRTTVFHWVRDMPIPTTRRQSDAQRRGTLAMQARALERREAAYRRGAEEYPTLCAAPTFRDFVCLYLAEGSKRCRNTVAIGNSDPAVVALADRRIGRLTERRRTYAIQYHADQDLHDLVRFWGGLLGIDPVVIALQRKSNSGRLGGRSWRSVHGVLTVRAKDTLLRARMQAWMDELRAGWL